MRDPRSNIPASPADDPGAFRAAVGTRRARLWPAATIATAFILAVLFDLLPRLHVALHWTALAAFAAAFAATIWYARKALSLPDAQAGQRRLETASGFAHRPLQALGDKPAGTPDSAQTKLWEAHRRRLLAALAQVRVGWPKPGMPARDPLALRVGLILLLVVAWASAAIARARGLRVHFRRAWIRPRFRRGRWICGSRRPLIPACRRSSRAPTRRNSPSPSAAN